MRQGKAVVQENVTDLKKFSRRGSAACIVVTPGRNGGASGDSTNTGSGTRQGPRQNTAPWRRHGRIAGEETLQGHVSISRVLRTEVRKRLKV